MASSSVLQGQSCRNRHYGARLIRTMVQEKRGAKVGGETELDGCGVVESTYKDLRDE